MQKLDPKAVWLFFIQFSLGSIAFFVFFPFFFIPFFIDAGVSIASPWAIWITLCCGLLFLLEGLSYVWAVLSYNNYKYELTDDGFRKESGVIFKKYVTIPYEKIQNVDIYRGILTRPLGLSDLHIQTAGMSFTGKYGAGTEGRLPGVSKDIAEKLRDELVKRSRRGNSGV